MELERKTTYGHNQLRFYVGSGKQWVQFVVMIGWKNPVEIGPFMPTDLGYHSPVPMYDGHDPIGECDLLDGDVCYYDGTSLGAEKPFNILRDEGEDALWTFLEQHWHGVFGEERTGYGFGEVLSAIGDAMRGNDAES